MLECQVICNGFVLLFEVLHVYVVPWLPYDILVCCDSEFEGGLEIGHQFLRFQLILILSVRLIVQGERIPRFVSIKHLHADGQVLLVLSLYPLLHVDFRVECHTIFWLI